jgi:hypothetical protein
LYAEINQRISRIAKTKYFKRFLRNETIYSSPLNVFCFRNLFSCFLGWGGGWVEGQRFLTKHCTSSRQRVTYRNPGLCRTGSDRPFTRSWLPVRGLTVISVHVMPLLAEEQLPVITQSA